MRNPNTVLARYLVSSGKSYSDVAMTLSMTTDAESKEFKSAYSLVTGVVELLIKKISDHEKVARAAGMPEDQIKLYLADMRLYFNGGHEKIVTDHYMETCDKPRKEGLSKVESDFNLNCVEHDTWSVDYYTREVDGKGPAFVAAEEAKDAEKKAKKDKKAEKKVVVAEPTAVNQQSPTEDPFGDVVTNSDEDFDAILNNSL